jgi:signal transduction histidine kinase
VRAIADAHGGTVTAGVSSFGGARFDLELPGVIAASDRTPRPLAERSP